MKELYIGLMSGTSTDSIDAALVQITDGKPQIISQLETPIEPSLKKTIVELNSVTNNEIEKMCCAGVSITHEYAKSVNQLTKDMDPSAIVAIGMHGQTIRHQPYKRYTLQIGDAALLAELTGIAVVADFRSRDIAAGGQGAPLAPMLHSQWRKEHHDRVVVNIGGFANITLLPADNDRQIIGYDTGPGNVLMDYWIQKHHGKGYDDGGNWAVSGICHQPLLTALLEHPFFSYPAPKSTGRDDFHRDWLNNKLQNFDIAPQDVQATLLEFTATTVCSEIAAAGYKNAEIIICGGGSHNTTLIHRLKELVTDIKISSELGIDPDMVEALAFAWLAYLRIHNQAGNISEVTGARGKRILGAIYHA